MGELNRRRTWNIMTFHILFFLIFRLVARCLAQANPCEEDCTAQSDSATGILILGGAHTSNYQSVEFWSAFDPALGSCVLDDYPREMEHGPTVNLVSDGDGTLRLVACNADTCEIFEDGASPSISGSWQYLQNTTVRRGLHSSATRKDAVLLIGGYHSNSTEWIPVDGSPAQPGPFTVRHGRNHCTMQISDNTIVVTGGRYTKDIVTQYHLDDGNETSLTPLGQPRSDHVCGVYQDLDGQQILLVTGGWDGGEGGWWNENNYYTSTEVTLQNHMRKLNFGKIG